MTNEEIKKKFNAALLICIKNDHSLILRSANERCITASLMSYMRQYFLEYDVDAEYNRNMLSTKATPSHSSPSPDIIVHVRETNDHNMLVLEAKGHWNRGSRNGDESKLREFVESPIYQYRIGIALEFCKPETIKNVLGNFTKYTCNLKHYFDHKWHDIELVEYIATPTSKPLQTRLSSGENKHCSIFPPSSAR